MTADDGYALPTFVKDKDAVLLAVGYIHIFIVLSPCTDSSRLYECLLSEYPERHKVFKFGDVVILDVRDDKGFPGPCDGVGIKLGHARTFWGAEPISWSELTIKDLDLVLDLSVTKKTLSRMMTSWG